MVICSRTFILIKGITGRQWYYLRWRFRAETILRFHAVTRCISRQTTVRTKTPVQQSSPHKGTARKWYVLPPPALSRTLASSFTTNRLPRAKERATESEKQLAKTAKETKEHHRSSSLAFIQYLHVRKNCIYKSMQTISFCYNNTVRQKIMSQI